MICPAGKPVDLNESIDFIYGDTYYQRWDCLKTFPYSTDDKNQYIDITSFFVESRINLDGRYDKQRGLNYNLGVLNTNFNLINKCKYELKTLHLFINWNWKFNIYERIINKIKRI